MSVTTDTNPPLSYKKMIYSFKKSLEIQRHIHTFRLSRILEPKGPFSFEESDSLPLSSRFVGHFHCMRTGNIIFARNRRCLGFCDPTCRIRIPRENVLGNEKVSQFANQRRRVAEIGPFEVFRIIKSKEKVIRSSKLLSIISLETIGFRKSISRDPIWK